LACLAAVEVVFSLTTEGPWTIAGTIAAIIAAIVVILSGLYQFVFQPIWCRRKHKHPCKAWFLIPSLDQRKISYAVQNHREHYVEELVLSANSEFEIEILYVPSVSFTAAEIYFGCDDQNNIGLDAKPLIKSLFSHFIERGTNEESPETHPDTNNADRHKYYHIKKPKNITRHETYSIGVKIQTRSIGRYRFQLFFLSEEVGGVRNDMFISVEEAASTRMRCVSHRWAGCFIQPISGA
jgi:hypothetical protein